MGDLFVIICLAIPAYQQRIHAQTAQAWAGDYVTAMQLGWRPIQIWTDINNIEIARNNIVAQAEKSGARLLLMCDSDTMPVPLEGGLRSMWDAMSETGAAVVGAAVPVRNGDGMNCEPAADGLSKGVGSDIGFCRAVQSAGQRVIVNYRLSMAHAEQSAVATRCQ
jgi:hypothetical protein